MGSWKTNARVEGPPLYTLPLAQIPEHKCESTFADLRVLTEQAVNSISSAGLKPTLLYHK